MIDFFRKYQQLFFVALPIWLLLGNTASVLNLVVVPLFVVYWYRIERNDMVMITFLLILILGDSRNGFLLFAKDLRVAVLVTMTLLSFLDMYKGLYQISKPFLWILPFFFLAMISVITNDSYAQYTFQMGVFKTFSYFLLFFNLFHFFRHQVFNFGSNLLPDIVHLINFVLIVGFIMMLISPSLVFYLNSFRFRGMMGNPNGLGNLITVTLPFYFFLFYNPNYTISKRYKIMAVVLIVFSLLLCSSRNALFACSLFTLSFYAFRGSGERIFLIFGGVIPLLGIILYALPIYEIVVFLGLGDYLRISNVETGSGRLYAWTWALQIFQGSPWFGYGFTYEEFIFRNHMPLELYLTGHQGGIHNSYFALAINTGILGLLSLATFFVNFISKTRNIRFLVPLLLSSLFSATFESWLAASLNAFMIFFLLQLLMLMAPRETFQFVKE